MSALCAGSLHRHCQGSTTVFECRAFQVLLQVDRSLHSRSHRLVQVRSFPSPLVFLRSSAFEGSHKWHLHRTNTSRIQVQEMVVIRWFAASGTHRRSLGYSRTTWGTGCAPTSMSADTIDGDDERLNNGIFSLWGVVKSWFINKQDDLGDWGNLCSFHRSM